MSELQAALFPKQVTSIAFRLITVWHYTAWMPTIEHLLRLDSSLCGSGGGSLQQLCYILRQQQRIFRLYHTVAINA